MRRVFLLAAVMFSVCGSAAELMPTGLPQEEAAVIPARDDATLLFELSGQIGIIEGIAYRSSTEEFFFGDVHQRCIWRRAGDGTLSRFSPEGEALYGVFQLAIDEPRQRLWAITSMIPQVARFSAADKGRAALVALDLATGEILKSYPPSNDGREHVLGDLLLAPDGTLYATDSAAPMIWRLPPGAETLEMFVTSPALQSLQGITLVGGGTKLLVSDYASGLLTIELATGAIHPLVSPAGANLLGLDGLVADGTSVVAVQNGVEPQRVLRLALSTDADTIVHCETLTAAMRGFDDLTLLTISKDRPVVIARSGWASIDASNPSTVTPHTVGIFQLR